MTGSAIGEDIVYSCGVVTLLLLLVVVLVALLVVVVMNVVGADCTSFSACNTVSR